LKDKPGRGLNIPVSEEILRSLPSPESISQHLVPVAIGSRLDETTFHVDAFSPTGTLSVGLVLIARATASLGKYNVETSDRQTADNMKKIGVALHEYAADFDRFPLALSELYPTYITDLAAFTSPTGKREVTGREQIDMKSDYVYVSGVRLNDLSTAIILHTKSYVHEGKRTVLSLNNEVKHVDEAAFEAMMARQGSKAAAE